MTRQPTKKPRTKYPAPPAPFEWRNHPVIVASGSAAATFLLCLAVFTQIVAPTQNAKLEIDLMKVKEANQNLTRSIAKSNSNGKSWELGSKRKDKEIATLKAKISSLEQELVDSRALNIFSGGNPYPNGLGLVRIGMSKDEIVKAYPGAKIDIDPDDPDLVTVYLVDSPFERVTYHLSDKTDSATISHISFDMPMFRSKYSGDFLYKKLVEAFGQPSKDSTNDDFMWTVGSKYSLFAHGKDGFLLMPRGSEPIFWALR